MRLVGISACVPKNVVTPSVAYERFSRFEVDRIVENTGVLRKREAAPGVTAIKEQPGDSGAAALSLRAVELLKSELGAKDAREIFQRVRRMIGYYRTIGLPDWIKDFVATGYQHYATQLPEAFKDRGTKPEELAAMMAFIFDNETLAFSELDDVACHQTQYNSTGTNANIIMFQDTKWTYIGADNTLAKTTVTYDNDTGEIFDADIEINHANNNFTINDDNVDFDLQAVLTHEIGHFIQRTGLHHQLPRELVEPLPRIDDQFAAGISVQIAVPVDATGSRLAHAFG